MTKEDIFEMAKEAGFMQHLGVICIPNHLALERFAELVRAYERDKWMERTAILIRGEREACAKLCEDGEFMTFGCAAAAIRARGSDGIS